MAPLTGADLRLMRETVFPKEFDIKVDATKVNMDVMLSWVNEEIQTKKYIDDELALDYVLNVITEDQMPKIKEIQIKVAGFFNSMKKSAAFCQDFWREMVASQNDPRGISPAVLAAKKEQLSKQKAEADAAAERRRQDHGTDDFIDAVRREEEEHTGARESGVRGGRNSRGGGHGRGRGRGRGRYGRSSPRRDSRSPSPPPRRRRLSPPSRRETRDSYVPGHRDSPRRTERPTRGRAYNRTSSRDRHRSRSSSRSPPSKFRSTRGNRRSTSSSRSPTPPRNRAEASYRKRKHSSVSVSRSPSPPRRGRARRSYTPSSPAREHRYRSRSRGPRGGARDRAGRHYDSRDYRARSRSPHRASKGHRSRSSSSTRGDKNNSSSDTKMRSVSRDQSLTPQAAQKEKYTPSSSSDNAS